MVMEYASIRGTTDGMDTTVITEIAEYFEKELNYSIPPMTPFVGSAFNLTRAGIHADGIMKDTKIYNIFDTDKILNRPAEVAISNTSGTAGIAYWIDKHIGKIDGEKVTKQSSIVIKVKEEIDRLYEDGRTTLMGNEELFEIVINAKNALMQEKM
jgi:isopropylmalate/homocitrate/citramalate synthase